MELITIDEIQAVIRLVPNGITKDGKFRFAIIIAIDSINDDFKQLSFECLMEVAAKIDRLLDIEQFNSNFGLYFRTKKETIKIDLKNFKINGSSFNQANGAAHWSNFFSNPENKIVINKFKEPDDFTNTDNDFEFVYEKVECCKDCGDGDNIDGILGDIHPECDTRDDLLNRIDLIDRKFDKVEDFYDNPLNYKRKIARYKGKIDLSNDANNFLFSDILSQIYQHPFLNGIYYGVCLDLESSIKDLSLFKNKTGDLILTKRDCGNIFMKPEILDTGELGIIKYEGREECILSIYDDYVIHKLEIIGQLLPKYYHGRSDYGLVSLKEDLDDPKSKELYEWKFLSKIQDWNNQLATTSEGLDKNNAEKVEGIILYHKLDIENYKKTFHEIGVNGHEILCQVGDATSGSLGSLCERQVEYTLSSNNEILSPLQERASIKIDTAVVMDNNLDLKSNEVFKWEGYNLCLPKIRYNIEENGPNSNELDKKNIEHGRDYDEFEDFFEDFGFTYDHKFINDSNLYLNDPSHLPPFLGRKKYTFYILKCDAVTGYRTPIGNLTYTSDSPVLDLATLIREELLKETLKIQFKDPENHSNEFSITPKNTPLYPVHILDRIKHSQKIPEDIEKNDYLVLNENNEKQGSERFIIPDNISYHFGQILGMTDNSFIQATNLSEYINKAYSIFKKAENSIPDVYFEDKLKYLPDFRNTHILIKPNDWKSWMKLRGRYDYEIGLQIFFYGNSFDDFFDDLKPFHIKATSSGLTSSNSLDLVYNNGIYEFIIPLYSDLNLRLYSSNGDRSLGHFKNYREISFANVQVGVDKPEIIDYTQPLIAERSLPDKKNNTFAFFTFIVKENPRRDYLTLLTESKELVDDGITKPLQISHLETELKDEYSREIFSATIGDLKTNETKEVFPNKFGFSFIIGNDFEENFIKGKTDFKFFELKLNKEERLKLRSNGDNGLILSYSSPKEDVDIEKNIILGAYYTIGVNYYHGKEGLYLNILSLNEENKKPRILKTVFPNQFNVPSINMSESEIKLNTVVEEFLIEKVNRFDHFQLEFQKFEERNEIFEPSEHIEYFVYRNEEDNKFKELKFRLKAYSKFKKYYPQTNNYPWSKFSAMGKSVGENEYMAIIPNNKKPQTPVFNFVPLFYKVNEVSIKTTENPICIRINRPQSEDLIGIVDAEYDENSKTFISTQNTSSLARDITKSIKGKTSEDNSLKNYLTSLNPAYLSKYYQGETTVKINTSQFRLLLFKPYYNYYAKQYQIILHFDYTRFGKLDDPMAKFILSRVQTKSINDKENVNADNLKVSEFSNAKFIPIRSQRIVSIKKNGSKHEVTILKNGKSENVDYGNSMFIICYFKTGLEEFDELVSELIPLKSENSDTPTPYLLVNEVKENYTIEAFDSNAKIGSIRVFEIEKHDDTAKEVISELERGAIDFNNHSLLRIIYAENLII